MSRLGHLTEQRKHFVEAYCRLGNGTLENLSLLEKSRKESIDEMGISMIYEVVGPVKAEAKS